MKQSVRFIASRTLQHEELTTRKVTTSWLLVLRSDQGFFFPAGVSPFPMRRGLEGSTFIQMLLSVGWAPSPGQPPSRGAGGTFDPRSGQAAPGLFLAELGRPPGRLETTQGWGHADPGQEQDGGGPCRPREDGSTCARWA